MSSPRRSVRLADKARINYYETPLGINYRFRERASHTNGRVRHTPRFTRYSRKGEDFCTAFYKKRTDRMRARNVRENPKWADLYLWIDLTEKAIGDTYAREAEARKRGDTAVADAYVKTREYYRHEISDNVPSVVRLLKLTGDAEVPVFEDAYHMYAPKPALPAFPRAKVLIALHKALDCIFSEECDGEIRVCYLERAGEYKKDVLRLKHELTPFFKRYCPDRDFDLAVIKNEIYVRADREEDTDGLLGELEDLIGDAIDTDSE
jgi:hypothetical protein